MRKFTITSAFLFSFFTSVKAQTAEKFLKLTDIVAKDSTLTCNFSNGISSCGVPNTFTAYTVPTGKVAKIANFFMHTTSSPKFYVYINDKKLFVDNTGSECGSCYILRNQQPFEFIWLKSGETIKIEYYAYNGGGTGVYRFVVFEYALEQ